jgi:hypothetical protein
MKTRAKAFEEGKEAYTNNVVRTDNPYDLQDPEWVDWDDGWEFASHHVMSTIDADDDIPF